MCRGRKAGCACAALSVLFNGSSEYSQVSVFGSIQNSHTQAWPPPRPLRPAATQRLRDWNTPLKMEPYKCNFLNYYHPGSWLCANFTWTRKRAYIRGLAHICVGKCVLKVKFVGEAQNSTVCRVFYIMTGVFLKQVMHDCWDHHRSLKWASQAPWPQWGGVWMERWSCICPAALFSVFGADQKRPTTSAFSVSPFHRIFTYPVDRWCFCGISALKGWWSYKKTKSVILP